MKKITLSLAGALLLVAGFARAEDDGIPLAVTTLAHPSLRTTPTGGELAQSDRYLKSGLMFLQKKVPARAVEELKDSVRMAPRAENFKALGTAYYEAGDKLKAAWAYRESLQLKPDAKVQALVDNLEGKDHPEDQFADKNDELRYDRLVAQGKANEKAGKRDSALRDYVEAWQVHNGPESRKPAFKLAAALTDDYLKADSVVKAIQTMDRVSALRVRAKDLSPEELSALKRLDAAETEVVKLTGAKLREHQKAMLTDEQAWERTIQEKTLSRPGNTNIEIKKR
jgi:tetratricopeptide (TPR) repeat protein